MNLSIGIVGLPNVGKSTLFNTITNLKIAAENYPFCTIEPNVGIVSVPDKKLNKLAEIITTQKIVPAVVEFHDIAGLVKDAHKGEGLGNAFLGNIRNTNIIVHVIRIFGKGDVNTVTHVENRVNPLGDKEIIETELVLKDMQSVEDKIKKLKKDARSNKKIATQVEYLEGLLHHLENGDLAIMYPVPDDIDLKIFRKSLFLLTDKQFIYLCNGDWEHIDDDTSSKLKKDLSIDNQFYIIPLNIKQEYELSILDQKDRDEYIKEFGLEYHGIGDLTRTAYKALGLISFFTVGEQEIRAWTIKKGDTAKEAGGAIHEDFKNKFIAADIVAYSDFVQYGGWEDSKKAGKVRLEGKEYVMKDGDIVIFKHGA